MKRVAFLTPLYFDENSYLGGGERYPLNLAKAVVKRGGYEVDLISYGDVHEIRRVPVSEGISLKVLPAVRPAPGQERLSWEILPALRCVDLVHIHQVFARSSEVGLLVAKLLGKPVCVTDHGGATSALGRSLGMLEVADRVVCYSRFGAGLIDTRTPTRLVMGGVDDDFFGPPREPVTRDTLVFVGRLMPHKGIDRLISALPPAVPLAVCGQPYDPGYTAELRRLAADKDVTFLTNVDDEGLRELYGRAIGVALCSVYVDYYGNVQPWPELMGFSLLEGMACGAPAICSRVGGMPEYVEHGVTGFVYDGLEQLTSHIEQLSETPALVNRLGEAARVRVGERFGLASAGRSMARIYDQLLSRGSPR